MIVRCAHCNRIYDRSAVHVTASYGDCDVYTTPCCGRTADTRSWKSLPDSEPLEPWELRRARQGDRVLCYPDGSPVLRGGDGRFTRVHRRQP